jgi:Fe2+ or Zn2+ uptake regulation protein
MSYDHPRWTKQLRVIMDDVYSSEVNLTADEIYAKARKRIPNISLGTVYRNLNKLVSQVFIASTHHGNIQTFSKHPFTNAHLECVVCKRLFRVPLDLRTSDLLKGVGMKVIKWDLYMTGICKECEDKCT